MDNTLNSSVELDNSVQSWLQWIQQSDIGVKWQGIKKHFEDASPEQLIELEKQYDEFEGFTDYLWEKHCQQFVASPKHADEEWRDYYIRCAQSQILKNINPVSDDFLNFDELLNECEQEPNNTKITWQDMQRQFEEATPEQLMGLEEQYSEFKGLTTYLWKKHCKQFIFYPKFADEDWRDFYVRAVQLDKLKNSITNYTSNYNGLLDKDVQKPMDYMMLRKLEREYEWNIVRSNFEQASPEKLLMLSKDYMEFYVYTDMLWQKHCEKFAGRTKFPEEDWCDFYVRCTKEDQDLSTATKITNVPTIDVVDLNPVVDNMVESTSTGPQPKTTQVIENLPQKTGSSFPDKPTIDEVKLNSVAGKIRKSISNIPPPKLSKFIENLPNKTKPIVTKTSPKENTSTKRRLSSEQSADQEVNQASKKMKLSPTGKTKILSVTSVTDLKIVIKPSAPRTVSTTLPKPMPLSEIPVPITTQVKRPIVNAVQKIGKENVCPNKPKKITPLMRRAMNQCKSQRMFFKK